MAVPCGVSCTRIEKLNTRRWPALGSPTVEATISTSSGAVSHGLSCPKSCNKFDTRCCDCATPANSTVWRSCLRLLRYTPSGNRCTSSLNKCTDRLRSDCKLSTAAWRALSASISCCNPLTSLISASNRVTSRCKKRLRSNCTSTRPWYTVYTAPAHNSPANTDRPKCSVKRSRCCLRAHSRWGNRLMSIMVRTSATPTLSPPSTRSHRAATGHF